MVIQALYGKEQDQNKPKKTCTSLSVYKYLHEILIKINTTDCISQILPHLDTILNVVDVKKKELIKLATDCKQ